MKYTGPVSLRLFWGLLPYVTALGCAHAADSAAVTYKCPGNSYGNTLSAKQAKERGCTVLEYVPPTVVQGARPRPASPVANGASGTRVDPMEQRVRDSDARRILETELKREEDRLAGMKDEFNNGEPERRGDDKNYQKYIDRVAELRAAITRKESDVAAIRRELLKLAP